MPLDPIKLEKRERRLLAGERAYCEIRRSGLSVGILILAMELVALPIARANGIFTGLSEYALFYPMMAFLALGLYAHAKVRHAESVRFHLERRRFSLCPQCGYNLQGRPDSGCPECGWRRAQ
jgi:hypothetical protein